MRRIFTTVLGLLVLDDAPLAGSRSSVSFAAGAVAMTSPRLIERYDDAKLPDLRHKLANCPTR
jgi:hypothetical protein